jgi:hypothetical protein
MIVWALVFMRHLLCPRCITINQASHAGKVVVSGPRLQGPPVASPSHCAPCVMITGGMGALGLLTAQWLITQGVKRLHLVCGFPVIGPAVGALLSVLGSISC